jgi:hypothetical protein
LGQRIGELEKSKARPSSWSARPARAPTRRRQLKKAGFTEVLSLDGGIDRLAGSRPADAK